LARTNTTFQGSEPSLEGYIFDYNGTRDPDQYVKTSKAIINYASKNYKKYTKGACKKG
jgi:hypothetical protein